MFRLLSQVFFNPPSPRPARRLKCISKGWLFVYLQNFYLCTYLLIYLLTPQSLVLLEKLAGLQLVKKFPAFCGTRRFITAFKSARHLSLTWASSIQSIPPHTTSWRSVLMLSSHLRLGLQSGLFPSGFPNKTSYTPLPFPIPLPCYLAPLRPKCSSQHPILKHPQRSSSLNVSDQVSHSYKTTGKIIVLYIF